MFIKLTAICRDKRGKRCSELEIFLRYDEIKEFYGKEDDVGSYTQIRCGDGTYMDVAEGLEYINSFLNAQTKK